MYTLRGRIANRLGIGCVEGGALVRGHVRRGKRVFVASGAQITAFGRERVTIGSFCSIMRGAVLSPDGGSIALGERTLVNSYSVLQGHGGITVGNDVMIAAGCVLAADDAPIAIEDDVWVGARVVILGGVTIGRGSVIGAGAVVDASVPPYSIAVGNPARIIASRKAA